MPLIFEDGRVPPRWAQQRNRRPSVSTNVGPRKYLNLALINNMPDAALEDTEVQFFDLLDDASGGVPIYLKLYSLPGVPRTERGQSHLDNFYYKFEDLWQNQFDGVIVTGTEPRQPNLKDEPYWRVLTEVFDWAERSTASTVLSCLAAHAGVLYSDGIPRHGLPDKQFGVFESEKTHNHALMNRTPERVRFPHSRWNEVREDELTSAGYVVLTKSADAGVDVFVKKKRESLFVHFQGHPEYGVQTLFKEYRRDIKRFLNRERETYPSLPQGYFDEPAAHLLGEFQKQATLDRRVEVMSSFPEEKIIGGLQDGWHSTAKCVYRNWLQYLLANRANAPLFTTMATGCVGSQGKRSAIG
ncbi:MAG: homoserine O-succinyltransferase [Candidatus Sulfotelmatobacter sp.]